MSKPILLFIVEGKDKEYRFVNEMTDRFFSGKHEAKIINLPAEQNIYMLYKILAKDDFDLDVVEVLRETSDEAKKALAEMKRQEIEGVYLFFDYDCHQNNTNPNDPSAEEIVSTMLEVFDNETENGKLYISYPMVEALYDYQERECESLTGCWIPIESVGQYKSLSGDGNPHNAHKMNIEAWREAINIFYLRLKCLLEFDTLDYSFYTERISPKAIYEVENRMLSEYRRVFVLSAFPEFLLDYFRKDFWNSSIKRRKNNYQKCHRRVTIR